LLPTIYDAQCAAAPHRYAAADAVWLERTSQSKTGMVALGAAFGPHLRFVARQPCLICGRAPSHAHHVRYAQSRGLGLKVSDEFTVPLCAIHHSENHSTGNERQWWEQHNIDPLAVAGALWRQGRMPVKP
jgi:hypothetical protein